MISNSKPYTFDRTIRILFTAGILVGIIWTLGYLSGVLIPFVIASLLAYIMNPTVEFLNRKLHNHAISIILTLLFYISMITLLLWIIIPMVLQQFFEMGDLLTGLMKNSSLSETASKRLPEKIWLIINDYILQNDITEIFKTDNFLKNIHEISAKVLPGFVGVLSGTANFILGLLGLAVILLYLVFIMYDFQKISEGWKEFIPIKYRKNIIGFTDDFNSGMKRYFRGQALIATIVGILFAIGFSIISLPMGIILGLFIGLLNMVPYLQTIGLIPAYLFATLQALQTGENFWIAILLVTIVFIIVQGFQDMFLVPKIMGKVTGFSPAIILLSLSIWGKLLGFLGLIIALPMTALLVAYYKRFLQFQSDQVIDIKHSDKEKPA